jgi:hypothetical protein
MNRVLKPFTWLLGSIPANRSNASIPMQRLVYLGIGTTRVLRFHERCESGTFRWVAVLSRGLEGLG